MAKLQNNKSPGSDNIPFECCKHGGSLLLVAIFQLVRMIRSRKQIPEESKEGIIVTIHKKKIT